MELLGTGRVFVAGKHAEYRLYKAGSAEKHAASDDITLKQSLLQGLNALPDKLQDQGSGVFRFKINDGHGYVVYKVDHSEQIAIIFHYHWNYKLDDPLTVDD